MTMWKLVLTAILATAACSSNQAPVTAPDGGASSLDATADLAVAADAVEAGLPVLSPTAGAPPVAGDGKFADVPDDIQGGSPNGWDLCGAPGLSAAPREGKVDPPAVRGSRYLVYRTEDAQRGPIPPVVSQAYFYFDPPVSLFGRGLWIDFVRLSGSPQATFSLYAVDKVCEQPAPLGTFSLERVLQNQGTWTTTCVRLAAGAPVTALGVRLDAADAEIGVDALRFGPACP
jgi:hypothetical protein